MTERNAKLVQQFFVGLCSYVVKSDLRILQLKLRVQEYYRILSIVDDAEKDGVNAKDLQQAADKWSEDLTPYTEEPARSGPDALNAYVVGLAKVIAGYKQKFGKVPETYETILTNLSKQRNDMFTAMQEKSVASQKFLILTKEFNMHFRGCKDYNQGVASTIAEEFGAKTNADLLRSTTAYLMLLEFSKDFATVKQNNPPLFAFTQNLSTLTDAAGAIKTVYMVSEDDGLFHEKMRDENKGTYERQTNRHIQLVRLHEHLLQDYISKIIYASANKIQDYYAKNPGTLEVKQVAGHLRKVIEKKLFSSVEAGFRRIIKKNREWLTVFSQGVDENLTQVPQRNSPLNIILEKIAHTPVTNTTVAMQLHQDFQWHLKRALERDANIRAILDPRTVAAQQAAKQAARQQAAQQRAAAMTQQALNETAAMDPANRAAEGLAITMDMDLDEAADGLHGLREQNTYYVDVVGQYIITENSYLQYQKAFPVIQIERRMTGSIIVGLNEAANRKGFHTNDFITQIEEVDNNEIDEFLKEAGADGGAGNPRVTRFTVVALGRMKIDAQDERKQMLSEVLSDSTTMMDLDEMFGTLGKTQTKKN